MTTHDPHTAPDLANYGTGMGPEYEWLISDHPWAAAERARRASEYFASELDDEPEAVEELAPGEPHPIAEEEISGVPAELAESVGGLAEPAVDPTADPHQLAYTVGEAEPDDIAVPRYRREYVEYRREHGEPDYVYPDHYVGETAAQYPPPGLSVPR